MTIKCSCSAGYNNGLDDAGAEAATVAAIVAALREHDGPGANAWMRWAAKWIEAGEWRPKGGAGT